jgi:methylenetetrahydrofolate reductase (NADPH)
MAVESAPVHIIDQINAHIADKKPFVAFEYFPPRTAEGVANLYARMERMAKQQPLYMDVTWGAGGTTSDLTLELCVETKKRYGVETNMHLTWYG